MVCSQQAIPVCEWPLIRETLSSFSFPPEWQVLPIDHLPRSFGVHVSAKEMGRQQVVDMGVSFLVTPTHPLVMKHR